LIIAVRTIGYIFLSVLACSCSESNLNSSEGELDEGRKSPEVRDSIVQIEIKPDTSYHEGRRIICDSSYFAGFRRNLTRLDSVPSTTIMTHLDNLAARDFVSESHEPWFGGPHERRYVKNYKSDSTGNLILLAGYAYLDSFSYDQGSATLWVMAAYNESGIQWTRNHSDFLGEIKMNLFGLYETESSFKVWGESYPYTGGSSYGQFILASSYGYIHECNEK